MKQINVYFDDKEYKQLVEVKNGLTWKEFILTLIEMKGGQTHKNGKR